MSEAPIKTCDYCKAQGSMPTFMNGETICYDCMKALPMDTRQCRIALHKSCAEVSRLTAELAEAKDTAERANGEVICLKLELAELRAHEPVLHTPSGITFDAVIAAANPDDLVRLTPPRPVPASPPEYSGVMGEAANEYHAKFKYAHPLPVQWRWSELWAAMLAASRSPQPPSEDTNPTK